MSVVREPGLYLCSVGYGGVYDLDVQRRDSDTAQSEYGRSDLNLVYPESVAERHAQSPIYGRDRIKSAVMPGPGTKYERVPTKNMQERVDRETAVRKKRDPLGIEKRGAHGFRAIDINENKHIKMYAIKT